MTKELQAVARFIAVWALLVMAMSAGESKKERSPAPVAAKKPSCMTAKCHNKYADLSEPHGPDLNQICEKCHATADKEKHRFQLVKKVPDLCNTCHDDVTEHVPFAHGPVAAGACTVCHAPHGSENEHLLVEEVPDLCLRCHEAIKSKLATQTYKHEPATEECTTCHRPHGAKNRMMLKAQAPRLCFLCHDDIAEAVSDATYSHDAVKLDKSCVNCHDVHASDVEHLLLNNPMDLCLKCHDKELKDGERKTMNIAALLKENPDHHGPIKQKNCTACHADVHGSEHFRLLAEEYPPEFYAPFDPEKYALCFKCHEPDLVKDEQTDKLTNFRNGTRNLHYLHVHRRKGRTCRACHNTHASKKPRHITNSVPFGSMGWKLPLNYEKKETGGSCQPGCHKRYRYDRKSPFANLPPK